MKTSERPNSSSAWMHKCHISIWISILQFSSDQSLSHFWLCNSMECDTAGLSVHQQLLEFTQTHVPQVVMPSNHLILWRPLLLLPSIFPSIRVFPTSQFFASGGQSIGNFSFNISPSNDYSGLISFRMDWLDLLAVQGTLKSLLQQHSSKASILRHSAFFIVQLSHPHITTGKAIALTRWTLLAK